VNSFFGKTRVILEELPTACNNTERSDSVIDTEDKTTQPNLFSEVHGRVNLEEVMTDLLQELYPGCVFIVLHIDLN
jgi:hypothetical protein